MLSVNKYFNNKFNKVLLDNFISNIFADGLYYVTDSFLGLIDELNKREYNGELSLPSFPDASIQDIVTGLFNGTITPSQIVADGIVWDDSKSVVKKFSGFNSANYNVTFDRTTGVMAMKYSYPLEITGGYRKEGSLLEEPTYIAFYNDSSIGYWNDTRGTNAYQSSYVAFSVGVTGSGADIELDHDDKIDYIDTLNINVSLPKQLI